MPPKINISECGTSDKSSVTFTNGQGKMSIVSIQGSALRPKKENLLFLLFLQLQSTILGCKSSKSGTMPYSCNVHAFHNLLIEIIL